MKNLSIFVCFVTLITVSFSQRTLPIPGIPGNGNNNGPFNMGFLFPWLNNNPPQLPFMNILRPVSFLQQPERPAMIAPTRVTTTELPTTSSPTSINESGSGPGEIYPVTLPAVTPVRPGQPSLPGSELIAGGIRPGNRITPTGLDAPHDPLDVEEKDVQDTDENVEENPDDFNGQIQNRALIAKKLLLKGYAMGKIG